MYNIYMHQTCTVWTKLKCPNTVKKKKKKRKRTQIESDMFVCTKFAQREVFFFLFSSTLTVLNLIFMTKLNTSNAVEKNRSQSPWDIFY